MESYSDRGSINASYSAAETGDDEDDTPIAQVQSAITEWSHVDNKFNMAKFKRLMAALSTYEKLKTANKKDTKKKGKFFKVEEPLLDILKTSFQENCIYFIILAHRFYSLNEKVERYKAYKFTSECEKCFNQLELEEVLISTTCFSERIQVEAYDVQKRSHRSFDFLEIAKISCKALAEKTRRNEIQQLSPALFARSRLKWALLTSKVDPEDALKTWEDMFTNLCIKDEYSQEFIAELKKGLNVGKTAGLSLSTLFSVVKSLLILQAGVRPFNVVRVFIQETELHIYITSPEEVIDLMKTLRTDYIRFLVQKLPARDISNAVESGLKLLDCFEDIRKIKGFDDTAFQETYKEWIYMLLKLSKFPNSSVELLNELQHVIATGNVLYACRTELNDHIYALILENIPKLSVQKFTTILSSHYPISEELLKQYFEMCAIPSDVNIKKDAKYWIDLFCEASRRQLGHKPVLSVFKAISDRYISRIEPSVTETVKVQFMLHLFSIADSTLFSQDCSFTKWIADFELLLNNFIQRNCLKRALLGEMKSILDCSDQCCGRPLQKILLKIISTNIVPDIYDLDVSTVKITNEAISTCCNKLKDGGWIDGQSSDVQDFCCNFLTSCWSQVQPRHDTLQWIPQNAEIFKYLTKLYRLIHPRFTQKVSNSSCKRYLEWITCLNENVLFWKDTDHNLDEVSYSLLTDYISKFDSIKLVANGVRFQEAIVHKSKAQQLQLDIKEILKKLDLLLLVTSLEGRISVLGVLNKYGVQCDPELINAISKYVVFPGEESESDDCIQADTSPEQLKLRTKASSSDVKMIYEKSSLLLENKMSYLKTLIFFTDKQSVIFKTMISVALSKEPQANASEAKVWKTSSQPSMLSVESFTKILSKAKQSVERIITGRATYSDITSNGECDLSRIDVNHELTIFRSYKPSNELNADGVSGIKDMLELMQVASLVPIVQTVCEQCQLSKCLQDRDFIKLQALVKDFEDESNFKEVDLNEISTKMKEVRKILRDENCSKLSELIDLFESVRESNAFYQFIRDKGFFEDGGKTYFLSNYQLVTAELQHQDYPETVLNHLLGAFNLLSPFMDTNINFYVLMERVSELDKGNGVKQLFKTVTEGITHIKQWFSTTEGDRQNLEELLKTIIEQGSYSFDVDPEKGTCTLSLHLEAREINWSEEEVADYVRRLGFLDVNKEYGDQFLHVNEIALKLKKLYVELLELGHPQYCESGELDRIPCNEIVSQLRSKMGAVEECLCKWTAQVHSLQEDYKWLPLFRIAIVKKLHFLLNSQNDCTNEIWDEINFLLTNSLTEKKKYVEKVKKAVHLYKTKNSCGEFQSPMHAVGCFLKLALHGIQLPNRSAANTRFSTRSQYLHQCPECSHTYIIRLLFDIYAGLPESYQVLICRPTLVEEDISLFLKRVVKYPSLYVVLQVNALPIKLQEFLMSSYVTAVNVSSQCELTSDIKFSCVHFIETAPSIFQQMPWITVVEHEEPKLSVSDASKLFYRHSTGPHNFSKVSLVYGCAGNGKSHYIRKCLTSSSQKFLTVSINEGFSVANAIEHLQRIRPESNVSGIFFNFTTLQIYERINRENPCCPDLVDVLSWFFFEFFVFNNVEDMHSGTSFRLPSRHALSVYIEIPSLGNAEQSVTEFAKTFPILDMVGDRHCVDAFESYDITEGVQLICKYLQARKSGEINRDYIEGRKDDRGIVKFSLTPDLPSQLCHELILDIMPRHVKETKVSQTMFIKYMERRCRFLDTLPQYNFKQSRRRGLDFRLNPEVDYSELGSTLLDSMIYEATQLCLSDTMKSKSFHYQLIYDTTESGDSSIGIISSTPESLTQVVLNRFKRIGVKFPASMEIDKRRWLDKQLSRALGVTLQNGGLNIIDESHYVLTLDYTIKMLNIHERFVCGSPVIIEGETGVGKTALVEMLSKLWNHSLHLEWLREQERLKEFINDKDLTKEYENTNGISSLSENECIDKLRQFCQRSGDKIFKYLVNFSENDILAFVTYADHDIQFLSNLFNEIQKYHLEKSDDLIKAMAKLLHCLLLAQPVQMFHRINIHSALLPNTIKQLLQPMFEKAEKISEAYQKIIASNAATVLHRPPFVTIFLDELNTSCCLGLLKEIIVDKTIDGKPVPDNIFIVSACNPHRGNSMATHKNDHTWLKGTYYVRQLHPTLEYLKWNYGSLSEVEEKKYILSKIQMQLRCETKLNQTQLANYIAESQRLMRKYAYQQLKDDYDDEFAQVSCHSCVSQRDIQRVFDLYRWFDESFQKLYDRKSRLQVEDKKRRALLVSLGVVYYMRLNNNYRSKYKEHMDAITKGNSSTQVVFSSAFQEEIEWYIRMLSPHLPKGTACTQALMENMFAMIACTANRIPLIIVGAPGSSKTFSFHQIITNLKGERSPERLFRNNTDVYPSLDPHPYQCSRRTTSIEIEKIFAIATKRQRDHKKLNMPTNCVVFMDEAGLPEESHESLKVLHYHLDRREVSFIAITNHILDAAKTNRAVSLFRPEATDEDLRTLAMDCSFIDDDLKHFRKILFDAAMIKTLCTPYCDLNHLKGFKKFFGLRDFMHFVKYLSRKVDVPSGITPQIVLNAIERNFNGNDKLFRDICECFLKTFNASKKCKSRSIIQILQESLSEHPVSRKDDEARYILVIDPSEDESVVRFLFSFNVLEKERTKMFLCSSFPGDGEFQQVSTIAAIRQSASKGHTILLCQTDAIHDSFYDLFNQNFRVIEDPEGPRYYANIAIGAHNRPCRVKLGFRCIVVVSKTEAENLPSAFLNRFEKYTITHESLLKCSIDSTAGSLKSVMLAAKEKCGQFIQSISEGESLFGFKEGSLDSIILSILPDSNHKYCSPDIDALKSITDKDNRSCLIEGLVYICNHVMGFNIQKALGNEASLDTKAIFNLISADPKYNRVILDMDSTDIKQAVISAMDLICNSTKTVLISELHCFIITLFQQWLVRVLCKKTMQLLTPEALILQHKCIPSSYIENYLLCQAHFSLRKLINLLLKAEVPLLRLKKVVCFTRSSPQIHELPHQYPSHVASATPLTDTEFVHKIVYDPNKTCIRKLSTVSTQAEIHNFMENFITSQNYSVCLLIANMQYLSTNIVNHVRILLEQIEANNDGSHNKVFILLLCLTPKQFFYPPYPSLFLKEWDYYYLDTIASNSPLGIQDWLRACLQVGTPQTDFLLKVLDEMLPSALTTAENSIEIGRKTRKAVSCPMTIPQQSQSLRDLFVEKGLYAAICQKFCSYWTPSLMLHYLQEAAHIIRSKKSMVCLAESMEHVFKKYFLDFIVYMVSKINQDGYFDILIDQQYSPIVLEPFKDILRDIPTPELPQLSQRRFFPVSVRFTPTFPFFTYVRNTVDQLLEQSAEKVSNKHFPPGNSHLPVVAGNEDLFQNMKEELKYAVEVSKDKCLGAALLAISQHPELWNFYVNDFIQSKLNLESGCTMDIIHQTDLEPFFNELSEMSVNDKMVTLHAHHYVYQLNYTKVFSITRGLNIKLIQPEDDRSSVDELSALGSSERLACIVINALFLSLDQSKGNFSHWLRSFREVVVIPTVKNCIYGLADSTSSYIACVQEKFDILITIYIVLTHTDHREDVDSRGEIIYKSLRNDYLFKDSHESRLGRLMSIISNTITKSSFSLDVATRNPCLISMLERLLEYFLSTQRHQYNCCDVQWLLEIANELQLENVLDYQWRILNVIKLYLTRLLVTRKPQVNDNGSGPLGIFVPTWRALVGKVLCASPDCGSPSVYVPIFSKQILQPYQDFDKSLVKDIFNKRMQQPLSHLYFLSVLEYLDDNDYNLSQLLDCANQLKTLCFDPKCSDGEKILLWIELQAVMMSVAKEMESYLKSYRQTGGKTFKELQQLLDPLNELQCDRALLGAQWNGLLVAYHLQKSIGYQDMKLLLRDEVEYVCSYVKCLQPIKDKVLHVSEHPEPYKFSFMMHGAKSEMALLYQRVRSALLQVDLRNDGNAIKELLATAKQGSADNSKMYHFRMMVFIVAYFDYFVERKISKRLAYTVASERFKTFFHNEACVRLVQCYFDRGLIEEQRENPTQIFSQGIVETFDPIYSIFMCDSKDAERDMCHSLACVIATVLGCPNRSNHLWYHLFEADKLPGTYMVGYLFTFPVTSGGYMLDCGIELSADGMVPPRRPRYFKRIEKKNFTYHSLYFFLWLNFGAFCVALLTQPEYKTKLMLLFSHWQPLRHYCIAMLRSMWIKFQTHLKLSPAKRMYFIMNAMERYMKVMLDYGTKSNGHFTTLETLEVYEKLLHQHVYEPTYRELEVNFMKHCDCSDGLQQEFRKLDEVYPLCPSMMDLNSSMTSGFEQSELKLLECFLKNQNLIEIGNRLLPLLVEFYKWINTKLAYMVTCEQARDLKIGPVFESASKRCSNEESHYLNELYKNVLNLYNMYIEELGGSIGVGGCLYQNQIDKFDKDTPLLFFINKSNIDDEEEGSGRLFVVIDDIVKRHNEVVSKLQYVRESREGTPFCQLVPEEPSEILVTEFEAHHGIINDSSHLKVLIRKCWKHQCCSPKASSTGNRPVSALYEFNLKLLEEDIALTLVVGKPHILPPESIRDPFKFRWEPSADKSTHQEVISSLLDACNGLCKRLPDEFKKSLNHDVKKQLTYEFNSANLNTMLEVIQGLRTVVEHLVKKLPLNSKDDPNSLSIPVFMFSVYHNNISNKRDVLQKIGIVSLSDSQYECLQNITITSMYGCLMMFLNWVDYGYFEYCTMPKTLKDEMPESDASKIEQIVRTAGEDTEMVISHLNDLVLDMDHCQDHIQQKASEVGGDVNTFFQKSIIDYLISIGMADEDKKVIQLIPKTTLIRHYVEFVVLIKRITLTSKEICQPMVPEKIWNEVVDDLWTKRLKTLAVGDGSFGGFKSSGVNYGFSAATPQVENSLVDDLASATTESTSENVAVTDVEVISRVMHDKDLQDKLQDKLMDAVSSKRSGLSSKAKSYTIKDVSGLLVKLNLERYVEQFSDEEIDGQTIFNETGYSDTLCEVGMESAIDQLRLLARFRLELSAAESRSTAKSLKVESLLQRINLGCYSSKFKEHAFDCEMLLFDNVELVERALTEVGVQSSLDKLRILVYFRKTLSGKTLNLPVEDVIQCLSKDDQLKKHIEIIREKKVDGDMFLFDYESLVKASLKELGMKIREVSKIRIILENKIKKL